MGKGLGPAGGKRGGMVTTSWTGMVGTGGNGGCGTAGGQKSPTVDGALR